MATEQMSDTNNKKIYELGYLLVPTLTEEQVPAEVEAIKAILTKAEVEVISEDSPKLIPLAYQMVHGTSGQKKKFDKAYFGWIKFQGQAAAAEFIKQKCDIYEHFLRFMIIKTVKDEPQSSPRVSLKTVVASSPVARPESTETSPEASKQSIDEAELEKTLESIVA